MLDQVFHRGGGEPVDPEKSDGSLKHLIDIE
jgi:hypothetical protein